MWIFISVIWWTLSALVYKDLFIPETIKMSMYNYGIILAWVSLMLLYFKLREKRIAATRDAKDSNTYVTTVLINDKPVFIEDTDQGDKDDSEFLKSNYLIKNIENLTPPQLLSYAINLLSKGYNVKALSILRKIVDDKSAPMIIRYSAYYYMFIIANADKKIF